MQHEVERVRRVVTGVIVYFVIALACLSADAIGDYLDEQRVLTIGVCVFVFGFILLSVWAACARSGEIAQYEEDQGLGRRS